MKLGGVQPGDFAEFLEVLVLRLEGAFRLALEERRDALVPGDFWVVVEVDEDWKVLVDPLDGLGTGLVVAGDCACVFLDRGKVPFLRLSELLVSLGQFCLESVYGSQCSPCPGLSILLSSKDKIGLILKI